jgi:DNA polymerase-3 subunit epsilon
LIDVASNEPAQGTTVVAIDLSQFELPVIAAGEQELAAHEAVLSQLDKSSGGRTVFRQNDEKAVA